MSHIQLVVAQFDVLPTAHVRVEEYTDSVEPKDEGIILDFGNELAVFLPLETAERTIYALIEGSNGLSPRSMERARDMLQKRLDAYAGSVRGQRARLDPGPLP